jgi:hypothetical protein
MLYDLNAEQSQMKRKEVTAYARNLFTTLKLSECKDTKLLAGFNTVIDLLAQAVCTINVEIGATPDTTAHKHFLGSVYGY